MQSLFDRRQAPQTPARTKVLHAAEYLLLAVGFICVSIFAYTWIESHVYQSYQDYVLESALKKEQATIEGYAARVIQSLMPGRRSADGDQAYDELAQPAQPSARPALPPNGLVGRIEIPRVDVSAIIREGVDSKTLRRAVGHVPGTALPGESGNTAIAAHRDTFFRGLRDIRLNDIIRVTTTNGTYEYSVRSTKIVKPSDVEVLKPSNQREMTLITCYPFNYVGHAPSRYIVKAEQVGTAAPAVFGGEERETGAGAAVTKPARTERRRSGRST